MSEQNTPSSSSSIEHTQPEASITKSDTNSTPYTNIEGEEEEKIGTINSFYWKIVDFFASIETEGMNFSLYPNYKILNFFSNNIFFAKIIS